MYKIKTIKNNKITTTKQYKPLKTTAKVVTL